MTSIAERIFGRTYGQPPEIEDGVRGEALVLQSVAAATPSDMTAGSRVVGSWKSWAGGIPLLVRVPGQEPYDLCPIRWMTRTRRSSRAISRAAFAVPSGLSSSTNTASQA